MWFKKEKRSFPSRPYGNSNSVTLNYYFLVFCNCNEWNFEVNFLGHHTFFKSKCTGQVKRKTSPIPMSPGSNTSSCQVIQQSWGRFLRKGVIPTKLRKRHFLSSHTFLQQGPIGWLDIKSCKEKGSQASLNSFWICLPCTALTRHFQ